jgi:hypothetical protein
MANYKRYGIAAATLAVILLTGQLMQLSSAQKQANLADVKSMPLPVELRDITLTAADGATIKTAALGSALPASPSGALPEMSQDCKVKMQAVPKAAALVELVLAAPCAPSERVVIHHNGMMFAELTDPSGALQVSVPALAENAVFIASFAGGEGAVASTSVEDIALFDRAAVQMQGQLGIALHAHEFGAGYDEAGHIWREAPGEIAKGAKGIAGFLLQLGDPTLESPLMAEVYSFPTGFAKQLGTVALSVDIEITSANCGKDIEAQTLQTSRGQQITVQTLDMSMPGCEAAGDFLMLKNLVNDMKVAFN